MAGVTETVKLNWCVLAEEWDAFRAYVRERHGEIKGRLGREVERAMREYMDADEYAEVEERIDRLIRAAGRTPASLGEKKTLVDPPVGETVRARARVPPEVKEEFAAFVKRETEDHHGVVLARALKARRDGGRSGRVARKLERVQADAEALLAEVNPDAEERMSVRERRTVAICSHLGDQFTRGDLEDAIAAVAGDSRPTLETYTERVLERLEYEPHPANEDLFIPRAEREELARQRAEDRRRKAEREAANTFGQHQRAVTDGGREHP